MKKSKVVQHLSLKKGESVIVNGHVVTSESITALKEISEIDRPYKLAQTILRDIMLTIKVHAYGPPVLSEKTIEGVFSFVEYLYCLSTVKKKLSRITD